LATFIERSRKPGLRQAQSGSLKREMTCCYKVPGRRRGVPWDVTIHPKTYSKDKSIGVLAEHVRRPSLLAQTDRRHTQSRCHSCNFQIVKEQTGERRPLAPGTFSRPVDSRLARPSTHAPRMDRGRQGIAKSLLEFGTCLTSLWPLRLFLANLWLAADEQRPFGGNAKYNGPGRTCQTLPVKIVPLPVGRTRAGNSRFLSPSKSG
jgi:hypothetical protein